MAENIFDTCVNMGVRTGSRLAQTAAEIDPADGIIGPQSLEALNGADPEKFLALFTIAKVARYADLCNRNATLKKYLLGWINRTLGAA